MKVTLLYEHPTWSDSLITRARARSLDLTLVDVGDLQFGVPDLAQPAALWINRVNAMPSGDRSPTVVAATGHFLLSLELRGQRVINGSLTHRIGGSKTAQAALFGSLNMATPASIAINRPGDAQAAADELGYPVLTKPNVGGSGSGIMRHDNADDLARATTHGLVDLGIDGTGLVQQVIESDDGQVYRVEMLGTELFYGTRQAVQADGFNYCAADGCAADASDGPGISLFTPRAEIVEQAAQVMVAANADIGGVEYLIDAATGRPTFYDFNPYSNFISGFDEELGFNPIDRYLDYCLARDGGGSVVR